MNFCTEKLEKFFYILLFINPFFDLIGGIFLRWHGIVYAGSGYEAPWFTPSLIFRMLVLLLFVVYTLLRRDKQIILTILPIGAAWFLTVVGEFLFAAEFSLLADAQYIAKFVFNVAVALVYWRVFQHRGLDRETLLDKLNWIISFTLLWMSGSIVLCGILGIGFTTYADRWGYRGSRGYFYSGNDVTAIIMLLLPIALAAYLLMQDNTTRKQRTFWLFAPTFALTSLLSLGTKTSFLTFFITLIVFYIYALREKKIAQDNRLLRRMNKLLLALVTTNVLMIVLTQAASLLDIGLSISKIFEIKDDMGLDGMLLSGRQDKLAAAFTQFKDGGLYSLLFGIGRGTQEKIIEMDMFESLFYYGIVGAVAMLWFYFHQGISFLKSFFKRVDALGLACFLSIGMSTAYLIIAGHILFSVSSGFYYAFILLYARLYYAPDVKNLNLLDIKLPRRKRQ